MTAVLVALGSVMASLVGLSMLVAQSGGDPVGGVAVSGVAVLVVLVAAGVMASAVGVAPVAAPARTGIEGRPSRGPAGLRPLRVADPDVAGRGARPRAPAGAGTVPAR